MQVARVSASFRQGMTMLSSIAIYTFLGAIEKEPLNAEGARHG
jgi:hypothetical protein